MVALAHLKPHLQLHAMDEWLDGEWELGLPRPDMGQDCLGVLPKQVTTLPQLRRMYPIMCGNYEQPL